MPGFIIIILAVILVIAARRKLVAAQPDSFHPPSEQPPSRTATLVETLVVGLLGLWLLTSVILNPRVNGGFKNLNRLSELPTPGFWIFVALSCLAILALIAGLVIGVRRKTGLAIAVVLVPLGISSSFMPGLFNRPMEKRPFLAKNALYTLKMMDQHSAHLEGVDLFYQGQHLGTTPLTLPLTEFWERIGTRTPIEPPSHQERFIKVADHTGTEWNRDPLIRLRAPQPNDWKLDRVPIHLTAKLDGETLYSGGGSHGGGGRHHQTQTANVFSPDRSKRLHVLFDQLRLMDYSPTPEWHLAFESYGETGRKFLEEQSNDEPALAQFAEELTSLRLKETYGLGLQPEASEARRIFDLILEEADVIDFYETESLAGQAVERIAPLLDQKWLIRQASRFARNPGGRAHSWGKTEAGKPYFSGGHPPVGRHGKTGTTNFNSGTGQSFPGRGYAIAHAIWVMDQHLDSENPADDSFENAIMSAILPWRHKEDTVLRIGRALGGSVFETFSLKNPWRKVYDENARDAFANTTSINSHRVNKWFGNAILLPGEAAEKIRTTQRKRLFALALGTTESSPSRMFLDPLFLDNHLGSKCPAIEFWPRFKAGFAEDPDYQVTSSWINYLVRMEPATPIELYPQTLTELVEFGKKHDVQSIEGRPHSLLYHLRQLPLDREIAVLKKLRQQSRILGEKEAKIHPEGYPDLKLSLTRSLPSSIDLRLLELADEETTKDYLAQEFLPSSYNLIKTTERDHTLVEKMLGHTNPKARLEALKAIADHPSPLNRKRFEAHKQTETNPEIVTRMTEIEWSWSRLRNQPVGSVQ